jgi:hypothetical protein
VELQMHWRVAKMQQNKEVKLIQGKVAYRKRNANGSFTLSWLTPQGWQDKIIWGQFNCDIFAVKNGMKVIYENKN